MKEGRNLCFYIMQCMYLDTTFFFLTSPTENFQTKVYRGESESVYIAIKFEDVNATFFHFLA